ncbi:MAG: VPS10 domain-containing protein [Terriglobales bacterium]
MTVLCWMKKVFILFLALIICLSIASAQSSTAAAESKTPDLFENWKFRNLGPAAGGGRVAAVAGIPGNPNVYYVGAAAGGVWKTTDAGLTWKAVFEKQPTASIGAIALAPSNPNLVWVGTGESNPRNDVVTGKGVYFSPDGGASWKFMGLESAGQISQVIVHPTNPDIVYVGVLGHVWGPNPERGVFRTTDGGKTWQKVLYVGDTTGVSDLVMDPSNPMVLFAGMWEFVRHPWMLVSGGESSGIYRSTDGGGTWKKLSEGLPKGMLGRIGLSVAPSNGNHVYALIEAKKGTLWETTDLGEHWKLASSDMRYVYRGFYFTTLHVAPDNENHIYFLSYQILESHDGGKTAQVIGRTVHVDHHAFWIDPKDASRMINGNDGGAYVSTDGGKNWRYLNNLPIEQFYMVAYDDNRPYLLCGGLQDNNGWCGPSNSLTRGGIVGADWWTAVGGDGEYIVPAGGKSNIIYADSQNGSITRMNITTGTSDFVRPYLQGVTDLAPKDLKYRFNWTSPIAVAPNDWKTVYLGGNVLLKSTDAGKTWTPISPDLTRNDKSKQLPSGGPVELDMSGAETFDTILSMAISPSDANVIWAGTDDGLVQITRDGGKSWANVTPARIPEWGRVQQIEVSPFAAGTAYVAFDYHEVENNHPFVFKTHDFGRTWTSITNGLPGNDPARVVRENPNQKGMLALGTDTGLFYSYDEGEHWAAMKGNFPTAPIYDLKFHKEGHDLIVASHGRGLFVLDDITPLEESSPQALAQDFHLYSSQPGVRWRTWAGEKHGFSARGDFSAPNPPMGVVISYYLAKAIEPAAERAAAQPTQAGSGPPRAQQQETATAPQGAEAERAQEAGPEREEQPAGEGRGERRGPVKIVVTDPGGQVVRTLYGPGKAGLNRVTWNMRYDAEKRLNSAKPPDEENEFFNPGGPAALPGDYKVAVTAAGKTENTSVAVVADPRMPFDMEAGRAQLRQALELRAWLNAMNESINRMDSLKSQIATVQRLLGPDAENSGVQNASYQPVLAQARALQRKLNTVEERVFNVAGVNDPVARLHNLARMHDRLQSAYRAVSQPYNQAPTPMVMEDVNAVRKELDVYLAEFNELLRTDVAAFNKLALEKGANTLFAGNPIELKGGSAPTSGQ